MKKLLLILAIISFILPIAYFNWAYYVAVYSVPPNEFFPRQNYFIEMFNILRHWASGEMGMGYYPLYSVIFGIVLLLIRANIYKFISDFNRGYVDAMSDD